jgi:hypothetical protein
MPVKIIQRARLICAARNAAHESAGTNRQRDSKNIFGFNRSTRAADTHMTRVLKFKLRRQHTETKTRERAR